MACQQAPEPKLEPGTLQVTKTIIKGEHSTCAEIQSGDGGGGDSSVTGKLHDRLTCSSSQLGG